LQIHGGHLTVPRRGLENGKAIGSGARSIHRKYRAKKEEELKFEHLRKQINQLIP
jgi:hypothetical protein